MQRMNQLDRLERLAQQLIEGPFRRLFQTHLHPSDLADHLVAVIEANGQNGRESDLLPNYYQILVNPADYARLVETISCDAIVTDLYHHLLNLVAESDYRLEGALQIVLDRDAVVKPGQVEIKTDHAPSLRAE